MATLAELVARFNLLDEQFGALRGDLIKYAQGQTNVIGGGEQPTPPPAAPNPLYETDINGILTHARSVSGQRVDPVVGPDCPNTHVCAKTGHVLSKARPDLREMFIGYCQRTSDQATNGQAEKYLGSLGSLFLGTSTFFEHGTPDRPHFAPDGSNWPEAADCFFNMRAYMTDAEKARDDQAQLDWAAVNEAIKNQHNNPPPVPQPPAPPVDPLPPGEVPL